MPQFRLACELHINTNSTKRPMHPHNMRSKVAIMRQSQTPVGVAVERNIDQKKEEVTIFDQTCLISKIGLLKV